jgi:glycosyltransferase involved in cell wall biosynthesis
MIFYFIIQQWRQKTYQVVISSALGSILYGLVASLLFSATFVLDLHNVDDQLSSDIGNYPRYLFAKVFTTVALRRADVVVVTSEADKNSFDDPVQQKTIVVANGFDSGTFRPNSSDERSTDDNRLLFFGNMGYEPNIEAVRVISESLSDECLEVLPGYTIHLAGPDSENIEHLVADCDNVKTVGLVDDIASYIRESAVVIVPLQTGGGTRLKIIESLACGTPVVSTPKGAEGWPEEWHNLTITELSNFMERVREVVDTMEFDVTEYEEIQQYTWETQIEQLVREIEASQVQQSSNQAANQNPQKNNHTNE